MEPDVIWDKIVKNAGEKFYTVRDKIEFVYSVNNSKSLIQPLPVNGSKIQYITKNTIEDVLKNHWPLKNTTQISNKYRAPSYIFAIMTDDRIV